MISEVFFDCMQASLAVPLVESHPSACEKFSAMLYTVLEFRETKSQFPGHPPQSVRNMSLQQLGPENSNDSCSPLSIIAELNSPRATGLNANMHMIIPPADSPKAVTCFDTGQLRSAHAICVSAHHHPWQV